MRSWFVACNVAYGTIWHVDVNECLTDYYGCVNADCNNTIGSFMCICHNGFMFNGDNNCVGK